MQQPSDLAKLPGPIWSILVAKLEAGNALGPLRLCSRWTRYYVQKAALTLKLRWYYQLDCFCCSKLIRCLPWVVAIELDTTAFSQNDVVPAVRRLAQQLRNRATVTRLETLALGPPPAELTPSSRLSLELNALADVADLLAALPNLKELQVMVDSSLVEDTSRALQQSDSDLAAGTSTTAGECSTAPTAAASPPASASGQPSPPLLLKQQAMRRLRSCLRQLRVSALTSHAQLHTLVMGFPALHALSITYHSSVHTFDLISRLVSLRSLELAAAATDAIPSIHHPAANVAFVAALTCLSRLLVVGGGLRSVSLLPLRGLQELQVDVVTGVSCELWAAMATRMTSLRVAHIGKLDWVEPCREVLENVPCAGHLTIKCAVPAAAATTCSAVSTTSQTTFPIMSAAACIAHSLESQCVITGAMIGGHQGRMTAAANQASVTSDAPALRRDQADSVRLSIPTAPTATLWRALQRLAVLHCMPFSNAAHLVASLPLSLTHLELAFDVTTEVHHIEQRTWQEQRRIAEHIFTTFAELACLKKLEFLALRLHDERGLVRDGRALQSWPGAPSFAALAAELPALHKVTLVCLGGWVTEDDFAVLASHSKLESMAC